MRKEGGTADHSGPSPSEQEAQQLDLVGPAPRPQHPPQLLLWDLLRVKPGQPQCCGCGRQG